MSSRPEPERADGGFTLIELLAGLVVSSALVVSLTGLIVFMGQVRDRADRTEDVRKSLVGVRAVSTEFTRHAILDADGTVEVDSTGYRLHPSIGDPAGAFIEATSDGQDLVVTRGAATVAHLALGDFSDAHFEYLVASEADWRWQPAPVATDADLKAIQLVLTLGTRKLPTVLWAEP